MKSFLESSRVKFQEKNMKADDPRFGTLLRPWSGEQSLDIGIVGVPFDEGVKRSQGRIGAAKAPDAIREQLSRYGTAYNIFHDTNLARLSIADCGNIAQLKNFSLMHERIETTITKLLQHSQIVVVLGGGNDISGSSLSALSRLHNREIGGANIDTHFDVRPQRDGQHTSGTPYRRLLEDDNIDGKYFFEIGAQGHTNAKEHRDYLLEKNASIILLAEVKKRGAKQVMKDFFTRTKKCQALFVSIDIDVVAQAFAPGSSAPSPDGLTPTDILEFAYAAGKNKKVRIFEIMEVNPLYDIDSRTSRLAANIILEFCAGVASQKKHS